VNHIRSKTGIQAQPNFQTGSKLSGFLQRYHFALQAIDDTERRPIIPRWIVGRLKPFLAIVENIGDDDAMLGIGHISQAFGGKG
jgi:hypothetical protein